MLRGRGRGRGGRNGGCGRGHGPMEPPPVVVEYVAEGSVSKEVTANPQVVTDPSAAANPPTVGAQEGTPALLRELVGEICMLRQQASIAPGVAASTAGPIAPLATPDVRMGLHE